MYFTRWVEIFKLKHIHDQEQEQQAGAESFAIYRWTFLICHLEKPAIQNLSVHIGWMRRGR